MKETCDRCGPATVATEHWTKSGKSLHFCAHHSRKHEAALLAQGFDHARVLLPV